MKNKVIAIISATACLFGIIFFILYNNLIILNIPYLTNKNIIKESSTISKKKVFIHFYKNDSLEKEEIDILWSHDYNEEEQNIKKLVQSWLIILDEEEIVEKKATLQTVAISDATNEIFLSFDRPPFNSMESTHKKLLIIEGLLKTLRENIDNKRKVRFLVHHTQMIDYHLDFSKAWPIEGFIKSNKNQYFGSNSKVDREKKKKIITLMIDPAGDAQNTGRIIGDIFERGLTLQCAQKIKEQLEDEIYGIRVILTRFPGETLEPLQNAAFSNRLNADFLISINFYEEKSGISNFHIYHFVYDSLTDFWSKNSSKITLTPYNQAHIKNIKQSKFISNRMHNLMKTFENSGIFSLKPVLAIPFKPLVGVTAPVIGLEIGLHNKDDWKPLVKPIVEGIKGII